MNKKVMALAVAGALAAPAAALAQVQIGGGLNLLYFSHNPDNDNAAQTSDVMQSSESELRISGTEKLGGGTDVWFQCATSIDGIFNGNTATTAGMCTRNSALGFRGGFGNVFFGNWDTPTKLLQNRVRGWFSGTNPLYGGGYTLLGGGAASGAGNGTAGAASGYSFYRRNANSVNYASPNWSGFSVAAAFTASNEGINYPDPNSMKPRQYGLNGMYAAGPLWVGLAYESHTDLNPASNAIGSAAGQYNGGTDNNITLGVGYTFMGTLNVRASYSQSKYEVNNNGDDLKVKGGAFYSDWQISGPHALHLAYIQTEKNKGSSTLNVGPYRAPTVGGVERDDTNASVITFGYSYDFSKRTQLNLVYNMMDNKDNATFNQGVTAVTVGGKQTSVGAAIRHSF